jgi:hypothetical protein
MISSIFIFLEPLRRIKLPSGRMFLISSAICFLSSKCLASSSNFNASSKLDLVNSPRRKLFVFHFLLDNEQVHDDISQNIHQVQAYHQEQLIFGSNHSSISLFE